jgi:hypothetical protein
MTRKTMNAGLAFFTPVLVIAFYSSAIAQPSTGQFDLVCTGGASPDVSGSGEPITHAKAPRAYSIRLRVDLRQSKFCQGECKSVENIEKVDTRNITFQLAAGTRLIVSREGGDFFVSWKSVPDDRMQKDSVTSAFGRCGSAPFTPFPGVTSFNMGQDTPPRRGAPVEEATAPKPALSSEEAMALLFVSDHRPISAALHTRLHALGYIELNQDLWRLTKSGSREVARLRAKLR